MRGGLGAAPSELLIRLRGGASGDSNVDGRQTVGDDGGDVGSRLARGGLLGTSPTPGLVRRGSPMRTSGSIRRGGGAGSGMCAEA